MYYIIEGPGSLHTNEVPDILRRYCSSFRLQMFLCTETIVYTYILTLMYSGDRFFGGCFTT